MAVKFVVFAALLTIVRAGYLNGDIAVANSNLGTTGHGGPIVTAPLRYALGVSNGLAYANGYNNQLTLTAGHVPQPQLHAAVAPAAHVVAVSPAVHPVATSSSYRHQISRSSASQVVAAAAPVVTTSVATSHGAGLLGHGAAGYVSNGGYGVNGGLNGALNGGVGLVGPAEHGLLSH